MTTLVVTSVGRRRYVVEALLGAARPNDRLIVIDQDPYAPALGVQGAIPVVVSPSNEMEIETLLETLGADAVISLHDYETVALAQRAQELHARDILFIGPDERSALTVLDKLGLARHLLAVAPELAIGTWPVSEIPLDVSDQWVLKDRFGSGSSGLRLVSSRAEAQAAQVERSEQLGWHPEGRLAPIELVAQPLIEGQEYNVDLFLDARGELCGHSLKRKVKMRGGETDAAIVLPRDHEALVASAWRAVQGLSISGNIDVDLFVDDSAVRVLDINPRFGGGYAFSACAGYQAAVGVWQLARGAVIGDYYEPAREVRLAKYIAVAEVRHIEAENEE